MSTDRPPWLGQVFWGGQWPSVFWRVDLTAGWRGGVSFTQQGDDNSTKTGTIFVTSLAVLASTKIVWSVSDWNAMICRKKKKLSQLQKQLLALTSTVTRLLFVPAFNSNWHIKYHRKMLDILACFRATVRGYKNYKQRIGERLERKNNG